MLMVVVVVVMVIAHGDCLPEMGCCLACARTGFRYFFNNSIGIVTVSPGFTSTSMVMGPVCS